MITFDFIVNIILVYTRFYRCMEIEKVHPFKAVHTQAWHEGSLEGASKSLRNANSKSFHDDSIRLQNFCEIRGRNGRIFEYLLRYIGKEGKKALRMCHERI